MNPTPFTTIKDFLPSKGVQRFALHAGKAFEGGSYETWFGQHSHLTTRAGEIIERESLEIFKRLKPQR